MYLWLYMVLKKVVGWSHDVWAPLKTNPLYNVRPLGLQAAHPNTNPSSYVRPGGQSWPCFCTCLLSKRQVGFATKADDPYICFKTNIYLF